MSFFESIENENLKNNNLKKDTQNEPELELDDNNIVLQCREDICDDVIQEDDFRDKIDELRNYTNDKSSVTYKGKNGEALNTSLASVVELFDKANKNVVIHKLKVSVGGENEDELHNYIKSEFAKLTKRIDELEIGSRERVNRISEISTNTKESLEASILSTKREVVGVIKASKPNVTLGYVFVAILSITITSMFFLKDDIMNMILPTSNSSSSIVQPTTAQ